MKLNLSKFVAVAGVLFAGGLTASAAERLSVNVPFSFEMAGLQFQPGQYTVNQDNNGVLMVQGSGRGAVVLTVPTEYTKSTSANALRFVTDGHEYHLVGVKVQGDASRAVNSLEFQQEHKLSLASR